MRSTIIALVATILFGGVAQAPQSSPLEEKSYQTAHGVPLLTPEQMVRDIRMPTFRERREYLARAHETATNIRNKRRAALYSACTNSKDKRYVTVTAYTSRPEETDSSPFITANGTYVRWGIVASNNLPFGTIVCFRDLFKDQFFIVTDRMHRRFDGYVDVWFSNLEAAEKFGKQKKARVWILEGHSI